MISGYPNSGRHNGTPWDHPCQVLAPWDVNCGRDWRIHRMTDGGNGVAIIYRDSVVYVFLGSLIESNYVSFIRQWTHLKFLQEVSQLPKLEIKAYK